MEGLNNRFMQKKYIVPLITIGVLFLLIGFYYMNTNKNHATESIELKTQTDSILATATGMLNDDVVKNDSTELKVSKEEVNKKLNKTEKEKNVALQQKAKNDILEGPFAKMNCDEILKMYCENMMEYSKTGNKDLLSKLPLGEDAKFTGCLSMPDIKPKVDSIDRLVRKLLRNKSN